MLDADLPDMPTGFAEGLPERQRRIFWQEEVGEETTRVAKDGPVPSGDEDFDRAWRHLSNDRPEVPPEECMLRRKLIRKYFWTVSKYSDV